MSFEAVVHAQAIELDRLSLQMTSDAGAGHPTTALSLGHIVTTLMFSAMRWSPDYPDYPTSDRLVLSEGHAVPIVYAAAAKLGMMDGTPPGGSNEDRRRHTIDDLSTLRAADSLLDGHPNPIEGMPLFDAATGSLGQGLSVAAGLGKAARIDGIDKLIYCIIGDGEFREGQIAEAIDFIMDHKLNNVLTLVNANQYGQAVRRSKAAAGTASRPRARRASAPLPSSMSACVSCRPRSIRATTSRSSRRPRPRRRTCRWASCPPSPTR